MNRLIIFTFTLILLRGVTVLANINPSDTLSIENYLNTKNIKAEKTREGIFYTVETEGKGTMPRQGDYLKIKYTAKLIDGKVFDQSPKDEPFVFQLGYRQVIPGWDIAFAKINVGTKATFYVPSDYAYGKSGIGDIVPPNTSLIYEVELIEVMSLNDYDNYMRSLEDKDRREFEKRVKEQFEADKKLIQEYAVKHKYKISRLPNGMSYLVTKPGKGENAKAGEEITVAYEGFLLDDKVFDSTKDREPFKFTLGEGKVIEGWEEGLKYFNKGSEGILFIPSQLAYGATPLEDDKIIIPAYSVLIFKIQVVDIKPRPKQ
jgi:peptidylprolyl isomerase